MRQSLLLFMPTVVALLSTLASTVAPHPSHYSRMQRHAASDTQTRELSSTVLLETHCNNAIRIRVSAPGQGVRKNLLGALSEECSESEEAVQVHGLGQVSNGNINATVTANNMLLVTRVSDGVTLLEGSLPSFKTATCSKDYMSFNASFKTHGANKWYGVGQLGSSDTSGQQRNCNDGNTNNGECVVGLERSRLGPIAITSVKFWIAIPWLYNRDGWGMFLNQPGDGVVDLSEGVSFSFTCQRQFDLWVVAAPAEDTSNAAIAVYNSYSHATGKPSPLPENAALYWQSRDAYKDQAEVIQLAKNFSVKNLTVGVIVIDLGPPNLPPYYRLDPVRFPDVKSMTQQVEALTGATVMPNLKPTSVESSDCPACGPGHLTDGEADDGAVDPSVAACRDCVWSKRLQPLLFENGIKSFWLDDDESNKFNNHCVPDLPIGAPCSSSACCKSGFCDPNSEKCAQDAGQRVGQSSPTFSCGPAAYCGLAMAGVQWPRLFADGVRREGESKPLILSRNVWAGAAADGVALWSSDIACSWTELRAQVTVGLSAGLSGIPFWSSDVGGFFGQPTPELVARWHQFGSVSPLYRAHGSRAYNEPWSFGPTAEVSISKSIQLRTELKQYIMSLAANATAFGTPLMVPLWFYYPEDPEVQRREIVDAFMFGPQYLAAPVLEEDATTRTVYLPRGSNWSHYYSGMLYEGGQNVTVAAPLDELPLFRRE